MTIKNEKTKPSASDAVNDYIKTLKHPLLDVVGALRTIILAADKSIGEEIKWNHPAFFYTGEMKPFDPKEYKRHIVVFNLAKKDCVRLIFPSGAKVKDKTGLLEGDYADGRRLANFSSMQDVTAKEKAIRKVLKDWLSLIDK